MSLSARIFSPLVALLVIALWIGPAAAEDKLTASDEASWDIFGYAADLDGDTLIVGACGNDDDGAASGAAYIYSWDAGLGEWVEIVKLIASDAATDDHFGYAVALSGDIAVVSALYDDHTTTDGGAAYVYSRDLGGPDAWGEVTKLVASDTADGDWFGMSVAIDGATIVVGADMADGAAADSGKVYVFERDAGGADSWGEVAILVASDATAGARFGHAVAISGDTVVAGASNEDSGGIDSGAAYVFSRDAGSPGAWGEVAKIVAADAAAEAYFGISVALDGDLAVVGAFRDDGAVLDAGGAYLYNRELGGADVWGEVTKLVASDAAEDDRAGLSVAVSGSTVAMGAGWRDGAADRCGAAYLFERDRGGAGTWGEVVRFEASDGGIDDFFGHKGVALSGGRMIVGAYGDDGPSGVESGSAYVFQTPFFVDGFESGTVDPWDAVMP